MKKKKHSEIIREIAIRNVLFDEKLTDVLHKTADYLEHIEGLQTTFRRLNFADADFRQGYSEKTKISALMAMVDILFNLYATELSEKEYGYANDLYDKVAVGYFKDIHADSTFAEGLRESKYSIDFESAEISLQARIIRLLEDVMPKGNWLVE